MKIALDAMGGDYAPSETVRGAVEAARRWGLEVLLVGPPGAVKEALAHCGLRGLPLAIVAAEEVVGMDEPPVEAVRAKPHSSIVIGLRLVKEGQAAAFVSAGNTGAVMAGALFELGRIPGIDRPALGVVYPTPRGFSLLIDGGANADCRPQHLLQFAIMGSLYLERVLSVPRPRVALLNVGEEEGKGSQLVQEAYRLLRAASILNFGGNVEGRDVPAGVADVVVADGFVGNVALKLGEGLLEVLLAMLREEVSRDMLSKAAAWFLRPAFRRVQRRLSYEELGGVPLLGVKGIVIAAHGRSRAWAIANALRVAKQAADQRLIEVLSSQLLLAGGR